MQCEDVERKLLELIEEELPPTQRADVLTHLHGCATCAAELSAARELVALVQTDPVPEPSPGFWEALLPSIKHRIEQEDRRRKPAPFAWLAGARSWLTFRPQFIAGLAVAAVSLFIVVRLPGFLPVRVDRQEVASTSTEKIVDRNRAGHSMAITSRPDNGHQYPSEPFVVAGEVVEEPSILMAAIQRLRWADEIGDRLETAWLLRPEADPADSLASLDEKERQALLDHLSRFTWSAS